VSRRPMGLFRFAEPSLEEKMKHNLTVSIIIPTHNRSAAVRRTLDAVCSQDYPLHQLEVIVAADRCIDDTVEMVKAYPAPCRMKVIEVPGRGAADARNCGASRAEGRLLIFIDDDIVPMPGFIRAHERWQRPDRVVVGYSRPIIPDHKDLYWIELRRWWMAMFSRMREPGHRFTFHDCLSGNFSIHADLFTRIGGFDTGFSANHAHEDYELGVRLIEAGAEMVFAADAVGDHYECRDLHGSFKRKQDEGRGDVMLGTRHPELIPALPLSNYNLPFSSLTRIIRHLVFRSPKVAYTIALILRLQLGLLEQARRRYRWRSFVNIVLDYWYWVGVASELKTKQELIGFLARVSAKENAEKVEVEIDLCEGLEAAERSLDEKRPASVRLRYRKHLIGRIPASPGAEPLRGIHLRSILAREFGWTLYKILVLENVVSQSGIASNNDLRSALPISTWKPRGLPSLHHKEPSPLP
jgi:glycosyltransferase involved in cell wall biosynthesis